MTIRAVSPSDSTAPLYRYKQPVSRPAVGVHELQPGIYQVISNSAMEITSTGVTVGVMRDKDDPPEPDARLLALEKTTVDLVKAFFATVKEF